jgi:hypothetical protein
MSGLIVELGTMKSPRERWVQISKKFWQELPWHFHIDFSSKWMQQNEEEFPRCLWMIFGQHLVNTFPEITPHLLAFPDVTQN